LSRVGRYDQALRHCAKCNKNGINSTAKNTTRKGVYQSFHFSSHPSAL